MLTARYVFFNTGSPNAWNRQHTDIAQDFVVDGGMTKAYVTPEGPPLAAPRNNAGLSEHVDAIRGTGVPDV